MFDIVSFCDNYNIPYAYKGKNIGRGWIGLNCPFHFDSDYHLGFNTAGDYTYCWKCGGHSLLSVVQQYVSTSTYEASQILERYGNRRVLSEALNVHHPKAITMPGDPLSALYRIYLRKRGFDPDHIAEKYKVTAGGIVGDWKYRLLIPLFYQGRVISFQGRDITGNSDIRYKTLSLEKSLDDPKNYLYNMDNAKGDAIMVCEGPTDVWRIGDSCVSTWGTSTTEEQVRKLYRYKKVFIVFDPDDNAQKRAGTLGNKIAAMGGDVEIIHTGLDHDPGAMTEDEVKSLREELGFENS